MPNEFPKPAKYPLLETVLAYKGLPMKGTFKRSAWAFEISGNGPRTASPRKLRTSA